MYSSTVRGLTGMVSTAGMPGTISIAGHDLWRDEVAARWGLVYLPEQPDLTPYATVGEMVDTLRARWGDFEEPIRL